MFAVAASQLDNVKILCEKKAVLDYRIEKPNDPKQGMNALELAIYYDLENIFYYLWHQDNTHRNNQKLFIFSAQQGRLSIMIYLLHLMPRLWISSVILDEAIAQTCTRSPKMHGFLGALRASKSIHNGALIHFLRENYQSKQFEAVAFLLDYHQKVPGLFEEFLNDVDKIRKFLSYPALAKLIIQKASLKSKLKEASDYYLFHQNKTLIYQSRSQYRSNSFYIRYQDHDHSFSYFNRTQLLGSGTFGETYEFTNQIHWDEKIAVKYNKVSEKEAEIWQIQENSSDYILLSFFKPSTTRNRRLIMPHYPNTTLSEYFKNIIQLEDLFAVMIQSTQALLQLHQKKIIHGDIKENNILIFEKNSILTVKFIDFGLSASENQLYKLGDADYIAPECRKTKIKSKSNQDVFSFGSMIIRLIKKNILATQLNTEHVDVIHLINEMQSHNPEQRPPLENFLQLLEQKQSQQTPAITRLAI